MKIQVLFFAIATMLLSLPTLVEGQVEPLPKVVGPEYPVIKQPLDYQQTENHYCGGYFILEAGTSFGGPYLNFHYRDGRDENGGVGHDEALLKDVSVAVVPDPSIPGTNGTVPAGVVGLPKVTLVRQDGAERVWVISVTDKMLIDYGPCLGELSQQGKP